MTLVFPGFLMLTNYREFSKTKIVSNPKYTTFHLYCQFLNMETRNSPKESGGRLQGMVEKITFTSAESGYSVIKVRAPGYKDLVAAVGNFVSPRSTGSAAGLISRSPRSRRKR